MNNDIFPMILIGVHLVINVKVSDIMMKVKLWLCLILCYTCKHPCSMLMIMIMK